MASTRSSRAPAPSAQLARTETLTPHLLRFPPSVCMPFTRDSWMKAGDSYPPPSIVHLSHRVLAVCGRTVASFETSGSWNSDVQASSCLCCPKVQRLRNLPYRTWNLSTGSDFDLGARGDGCKPDVLRLAQGAAPTLFDGNLYVRPRAASNRTWITR